VVKPVAQTTAPTPVVKPVAQTTGPISVVAPAEEVVADAPEKEATEE
jgi:hypothetical protein